MKESIKLVGIVTEGVSQSENQSKYKINSEGDEYLVLSTGRQAIKDNIFIRKGQQMEIEYTEDVCENNKKQVVSKKSKIVISQTRKDKVL